MTFHSQRRSTFGGDAFDAHFSHYTLDSLAIYLRALIFKEVHHLPRTTMRTLQMFFVHQPHQSKIFLTFRNRFVVHVVAMKTEKATLFTHTQLRIVEVDPRPCFTNRLRPLFF